MLINFSMSKNRYKCHPAVKALCRNHRSCSKVGHSGSLLATGNQIVHYGVCRGGLQLPSTCVLPEGFTLEGEYNVCKNMYYMISRLPDEGSKPKYVLENVEGKYSTSGEFFSG